MNLEVEVLVNRDHPLPTDYVPNNLYVTDNNENNFHKYSDPNLKPMIRLELKPFLDKMMRDAQALGFNFIVDSGYRSYLYQQIILDKLLQEKGDKAYKIVALPGTSEHQTGLAFDIAYYNDGIYDDDVKETDPVVIWLSENSYRYGFILRYPKGKEDITGYIYEPWHFRFVGLELAKILYDSGLTLEEYYEHKKVV